MKKLEALGNYLRGTADSIETGLEALGYDSQGVDIGHIEGALLDANCERCQSCDWWFESGELVGPEEGSDPGYCDACREGVEDFITVEEIIFGRKA
jgi:hypothetical protein